MVPTLFPAAADGPEWVRLYVLLPPLPSSWAWRRPGALLVCGAGACWQVRPVPRPRASQTGAAVQPLPPLPAIEALCATNLHLHGVSTEDLAAMMGALRTRAEPPSGAASMLID